MPWNRISFSVLLLVGLMTFVPFSSARNKKAKAVPSAAKDQIEVAAHLPMTGGPVRRFLTTEHYSSSYLYAEHDGGKLTLIDVTKADRPAVLADAAYAPADASGSLAAVAGTAALVSSEPAGSSSTSTPQTLKIMDFSDPQNPKVAREFTGVTAMTRDAGRGLIFVANVEGIWILRQHLATDPDVEKAYANYVIYGSSMYPPGK